MNLLERALKSLAHRRFEPKFEEIVSSARFTNEWLDLPCRKPAKPRGCSQWISLSIPGYDFDMQSEDFVIRLPDGKIVMPVVELVDSFGSTFETKSGPKGGSIIAFRVNEKVKTLSDDSQKVTVRIRSDEQFESGRICWVTLRLK